MKTRLLSLLAVVAIAFGFIGCNEAGGGDGIDPNIPTVKKFFEITGAQYVAQNLPQSTLEYVPMVEMNSTVIPGGSNYIKVESILEAAKILIGVDGLIGYFEMTPDKMSKEFVYDLVMVVSQNLEDDNFSVVIGIVDEDGEVTEYYTTDITIHEVGTGTLQVSLSFDNNKDVDLHLIEPNGYHIYYNQRESENGGVLDLDSNPSCSIDGINNENITYGEDAYVEPGEYTVYVDMWENCDPSVATNFVLTVFYGGQLLQTVEGVNPISATFPIDEPSNGGDIYNINPVCHFIIPDKGQAKPATTPKKALPAFLRSAEK